MTRGPAVPLEHLWHIDFVLAQRLAHPGEIRDLVTVVDLLAHDILELPEQLIETGIGHTRRLGAPTRQPADHSQVALEQRQDPRPLNLHNHPGVFAAQVSAMFLRDGGRRKGMVLEDVEYPLERPVECLCHDLAGDFR